MLEDSHEVLAEQAAAAMRAIAGTVRDAPPLRLAAAPAAAMPEQPGPARGTKSRHAGVPGVPPHGPDGADSRPDRARRRPLPRHWRLWLAPLTAAVAVSAVGITLALVRVSPAGHLVPGRTPSAGGSTAAGPPFQGQVPPYYVAISAPAPGSADHDVPLVVAATRTARVLGRVATPPGTAEFAGVTGAADDRTFVVAAGPHTPDTTDPYPPQRWYLLRLSADGRPAGPLTRLPIPATTDGTAVAGIALSPDGGRLAVALEPDAAAGPHGPALLRVYSVATGKALRTWTTGDAQAAFGWPAPGPGDPNTALRWVNGERSLAIAASWASRPARPSAAGSSAATQSAGPDHAASLLSAVRLLDTSRPGGDLLADSRLLLSCPVPGSSVGRRLPAWCAAGVSVSDRQVTADGSTMLQVKMPPNSYEAPGATLLTVTWSAYSTSSGRLTRVLHSAKTGGSLVYSGPRFATIEWASPAGGTLITYWPAKATHHRHGTNRFIGQLAIISKGRYTPLPTPPTNHESVLDTIAW